MVIYYSNDSKNCLSIVQKVVKVDPNPFGTRRKSQEVINGWRSSLELNQVEGIQKECIDALNKLNYIIIQNDRDQKDLSKRLFR